MRKIADSHKVELVYGSLELLILRTPGKIDGHGIAKSIESMSDDALNVDHGSLYPALRRLPLEVFIEAEWGVSDKHQRTRYHSLTPIGRASLWKKPRAGNGSSTRSAAS